MLVCLIGSGCTFLGTSQRGTAQRLPVPARVAYVGNDGQVSTVDLAGGEPRRVSQVAGRVEGETTAGWEAPTGRWPTWAPDASRLAFVRLLIGPSTTLTVAQVWTVAHDGADLRKVWESTDREPIYLAWSPDGRKIGLLVQATDDFELVIVDAVGSEPPRRVASGNPFYYVWSGDSASLLVHVGSERPGSTEPALLTIRLRPGEPDDVRSFGVVPGEFRTPAWSADGRLAVFVADGADRVPMLSVVDPRGGDITRLAAVQDQTAFALSRDAARVAWASRSDGDRLTYDGLEVVSTDGRRRVRVTDDAVIAFYWSPDDRQLAYLTLERSGQTVTWHLADADGNASRRLTSFAPTADQIRVLAFFDQYAISHGLWSPDGTSLVYAVGVPGEDRAFGAPTTGTISSVSTADPPSARRIGSGGLVVMPVPAP